MTLLEFVQQVPKFDTLPAREKIRLFAWHLHVHRKQETFDNAAIRDCFRQIDAVPPDVSIYLPRMADAKPPELVRVRGEYKLEGIIKRGLDVKYGMDASSVAVSRLLADLPGKIPNLAERAFLGEVIRCYRVGAFRATIVMTWNLAFDHVLGWIVADPMRLATFNAALPTRFPKKPPQPIAKRVDFEELKEFDVIEVCRTARLLSKGQIEILRERLKRRNAAAHPSDIVVEQPQADDTITDLVNNIVLALS